MAGDWRRLDERIEGLSSEIEALARQDKGCERLMTVPGIGPIIFEQAFGLPEVLVSSQHLASFLQEGRENANIDAGLGFIWRISVELVPKNKKNKLFMIIPSQAGIPLLTPAAPFN